MSACMSCKGPMITGLDFGNQPVTNHYHEAGHQPPEHPMVLAQCLECALVQLVTPFPYQSVSPPHDWIAYREPEGHLDHMCAQLVDMFKERPEARVLGLSYKDGTTVDRMKRAGFENTHVLDVRHDLGSDLPHPNIESVPGLLNAKSAQEIVDQHGAFDIIIARHVLEHAENLDIFMTSLNILLSDKGVIVFEVPDCEANMQRFDVAMIWEEHATYFTPYTLNNIMPHYGYDVTYYKSYPLSFENCLVVFAVNNPKAQQSAPSTDILQKEHDLFAQYVREVQNNKSKIQNFLKAQTEQGEKFAIYGAGHLACAFINLYELQDYVTCIVDDTPDKQGLYLPGTGVLIEDKGSLQRHGITKCLLALSVEIEDKVIANNHDFINQDGLFYSIFAASTRSFEKLL